LQSDGTVRIGLWARSWRWCTSPSRPCCQQTCDDEQVRRHGKAGVIPKKRCRLIESATGQDCGGLKGAYSGQSAFT
jgi:hypothetical protein